MTRGWQWPAGVIVVLGATVALNAWVVWRANADPTVAVEPDYYAKAVSWDTRQAQRRRAARLGWTASAALSPVGPDGSTLTVSLRARDGTPLAGARARVTARHVAYANAPVAATLTAGSDGRYAAALPLRHPGLWDLELEVSRGTDRLVETIRVEAGHSP